MIWEPLPNRKILYSDSGHADRWAPVESAIEPHSTVARGITAYIAGNLSSHITLPIGADKYCSCSLREKTIVFIVRVSHFRLMPTSVYRVRGSVYTCAHSDCAQRSV